MTPGVDTDYLKLLLFSLAALLYTLYRFFRRWHEAELVLAVHFFADLRQIVFQTVQRIESQLPPAGIFGQGLAHVLLRRMRNLRKHCQYVKAATLRIQFRSFRCKRR